MAIYIHFKAESFEKYGLFGKKLEVKVFRIKFSTKKLVGAYVYLPPRVELRGSKDWYDWNSRYRNGKLHSL